MAGVGFVDDFTEIRVASYPTDRQHLPSQAAIWGASTAAVLAVLPTADSLIAVRERWRGMDAPQLRTRHSQSASGEGEVETSSKLDGRVLTIPFYDQTSSRAAFERLTDAMFSGDLAVVGFRRGESGTSPPWQGSRYLIGCSFYGGLERPNRGQRPTVASTLRLKSQWAFAVVPQIEASGVAFTTAGANPIIWGVNFTAITAATTTVTVGSQTLTVEWAAGTTGGALICPSPPYLQKRHYSSSVVATNTQPISLSGDLPLYLRPNTSYTITTTGGTATPFWLRNYPGM